MNLLTAIKFFTIYLWFLNYSLVIRTKLSASGLSLHFRPGVSPLAGSRGVILTFTRAPKSTSPLHLQTLISSKCTHSKYNIICGIIFEIIKRYATKFVYKYVIYFTFPICIEEKTQLCLYSN